VVYIHPLGPLRDLVNIIPFMVEATDEEKYFSLVYKVVNGKSQVKMLVPLASKPRLFLLQPTFKFKLCVWVWFHGDHS
jgi:hypothetical protein